MRQEHITVVSGLPRSGTSMMMRMLERGGIPIVTDDLRKADDDNPRGYYEFEPVKQLDKDSSWLPGIYGKAVKVIYILLYKLPLDHPYKVIFMRRSLDEVLASQKTMLNRRGEGSPKLKDEELTTLFQHQLQELDEWMNRQRNFNVLNLNHKDLLTRPQQAVAEIDGFLNVPLDTAAMIGAVDPLLYRKRSADLLENQSAPLSDDQPIIASNRARLEEF